MPQPAYIGRDEARRFRCDVDCNFNAFFVGARGHQFGHAVDQILEVALFVSEVQAACFNGRDIEQILDESQKRHSGFAGGLEVARLFRRCLGLLKQMRHAQDAVERCADLMADGCQKTRFGMVGGLGLLPRFDQFRLREPRRGDVAANALQHQFAAGEVARHGFMPGPDGLVVVFAEHQFVNARAGRVHRLDAGHRKRQAHNRFESRGRFECFIGIDDLAIAGADGHHVAESIEDAGELAGKLSKFPFAVKIMLRLTGCWRLQVSGGC